jgi:hypothetical protein
LVFVKTDFVVSQFLQGQTKYAHKAHHILIQESVTDAIIEFGDEFLSNKYAVARKMADILAICEKFNIPKEPFLNLGDNNGYVLMFSGNLYTMLLLLYSL